MSLRYATHRHLFQLGWVLFIFLPCATHGQCPTKIHSSSTCIPATLTTNGASYRTEWKLNNNLISTVEAQWDSIPVQLVASYLLTDIRDVAGDAQGNIYIAQQTPDCSVKKWIPGAETGITVTGPVPGGMAGGLTNLSGTIRFFLHTSGDLYVAAANLHCVVKYPAGSTTGVVVAGNNGQGSANNQLNFPYGIFVDASGNLFIADRGNHRVMRWAPGAVTGTKVAGGNGQGSAANQFSNPEDVTVVGNNIFIADVSNYRIQRWQVGAAAGVTVAGGNGSGVAPNQIGPSSFIYVDRFSNVFCTGKVTGGDVIQRWAPGATAGTVVASAPNSSNPLFIDKSGNLVVGDVVNRSVKSHQLKSGVPFRVSTAGNYSATTYDADACTQHSNVLTLADFTGHEVDIRGESSYCQGSTGYFDAYITNFTAGELQYTWKRNGIADTVTSSLLGYMPRNLQGTEIIGIEALQLANGCITQDSMMVNASRSVPPAGLLSSSSNCTPALVTYQFPLASEIWASGVVPATSSQLWKQAPRSVIKNTFSGFDPIATDFDPKVYRITQSGEIFILDRLYPRILKFVPGQSNFTVIIGSLDTGSSNIRLKDPRDFVIDTDGTIYVADYGNERIIRFPPGSGTGVTIVKNVKAYLLLLNQNWIYMGADNNGLQNAGVYRCSKNGGVPARAINSSTGSGSNQLGVNIGGIWLDDVNYLYVTDRNNHRVQRWPLFGNDGVTVAGGNGEGFAANQLSYPSGLYVDGAGAIITTSEYLINSALRVEMRKWIPSLNSAVVVGEGSQPVVDSSGVLYFISKREIRSLEPLNQIQFEVPNDFNDKLITVSAVGAQSGCPTAESSLLLSGALAPSVSISASENAPCEGTIAHWSASITQPGSNPLIQWWLAGQQLGTGNPFSSTELQNGDSLLCWVTNRQNNCYQKSYLPVKIRPKPVIHLQSSPSFGVPANLQLQADGVLPQIIWKLNHQPIDTTHNWKEYGKMVAGKNPVVGNRANLANPRGLFVDSGGIFYTADAWGVKKWWVGRDTSDHIIYFGNGPQDIARFGDSLYVVGGGSVQNRYVVRRYFLNGSGQPVIVAGRTGIEGNAISDSQLTAPRHLWLQKDRDLFVTDATRTTLWPRTSVYCTVISDQYATPPMGIVGDGNEHIYVLTVYGNLYKHHLPTQTRQLLHAFGSLANDYDGLTMDKQGYLYFTASRSNSEGLILRYNPSSDEAVVIAGEKGVGAAMNQVRTPFDLGLDESGNLFVLDGWNNRVMMFTADSFQSRTVTDPGMYTVTATGYNGCQTTDSIHIYSGAYIFSGSGSDWNDPAMWEGGAVPPPVIGDDIYVEINPAVTDCILNGNLRISRKSTLVVKPDKNLVVTGSLIVE